MKIDPKTLTIKTAHEHLIKGDFSARELAQTCLGNLDEDLNAFIPLPNLFDDVLVQADEADKKIKTGKVHLLTGIPIAIKNNILIEGRITTAGSKILKDYKASYDATVIKKLKEQGAVLMEGANLDEFAMGSSTENSAFGVTKNPYDRTRVAGGSSGGSAVAVVSGMALVALGTDTGGSVRLPASFCGAIGFKPTYGAVSRYGAIAMGSSLDQISPVAKTVEDIKILFECIKGVDPMDSMTLADENYQGHQPSLEKKVAKKKKIIGVPKNFVKEGVGKDILENFNESIKSLENKGYQIKEVDLAKLKHSLAVYYIIMPAEVSTNMARYDGMRYGASQNGDGLLESYLQTRGKYLGKEVRRRIMLGTYVLSAGYHDAYYNKAVALRQFIKKDLEKVFAEVDVIATPTSPAPAFKIGEKTDDPVQMYLADIFTVSANVAGIPAISLPAGFVEREGKSLPLGFQLLAPQMEEELLFEIGNDFSTKNN